MKRLYSSEQHQRVIANITIGCSVVLFAILVYRFQGVMSFSARVISVLFPVVMGFVIAFLLDPPMNALERLFHRAFDRFFKSGKPPKTLYRVISAALCYALLMGMIVGFLSIVLPQLVNSITRLVWFVRMFISSHSGEIEGALRGFNWPSSGGGNDLYKQLMKIWDDFTSWILSYTGTVVLGIVNVSASVGSVISQFFIGMIISIYMLFGKERFAAQTKKLGYSFLPADRVELLSYWFRMTHRIFSGYVAGQLLVSLALGVVCYVLMMILPMLRTDYALLISVIVGVTNIVPIFGPIVGGVIGTVIMLVISLPDVTPALWFGGFILVLQQLEGNVIAPHILGDSIGISSFWIMVSILLGGGLFGLPGILLGIPVFSVLYAVVQTVTASKLKKLGMPIETAAYLDPGNPPRPSKPDEKTE